MQKREKLEPYRLALDVWSKLGKAVQKSNNTWEKRQNFWIGNHKVALQTLMNETIQSAVQFNGRSTATVTHSLVKILYLTNSMQKLGEKDFRPLWNALLLRTPILLLSNSFNAQETLNLLWAYAKAADGIKVDGQLLDAIAKKALLGIADYNPQDLSNTAWAFAKMNHEAPLLFDAIARAAPVCISDFNPQNLSNMAWAFAKMNHEAPLLFDAIARAAPECIADFNPQDLSNTAWAFATMNHKAPLLFDAIARAAPVRIRDFSPQNLSNTAWAFATMNHKVPLLFDAIARAAPVCINNFNPQNLANAAWSFAVFSMEPDSFIPADSHFAQALLSRHLSASDDEDLCQLHQLQLWCKEQTGAQASWFPDELSQRCQAAFVSAEVELSCLQNNVVAALGKLQDITSVEVEVSTNSGYSLDAVVVFLGKKIGVEVDGPSHFVGQSQSPNGSPILKRRQVRALEKSLKLISVPYWEWIAIKKQGSSDNERRDKKQRYLQKLLEEVD
jgi:ribonuclease HI